VDALAEMGYMPDAVVTLQPTSPLRTARHISEAAIAFSGDPNADSLVSCVAVPHIYHPRSVMKLGAEGYLKAFLGEDVMPLRRQDKEPVYARNGAAIYITRRERLQEYIFGGNLLPYFMDPADSIDIDTEADFAQAERIMLERACRS
jgi:CMP-N-acetylneuraminic acid synthetase